MINIHRGIFPMALAKTANGKIEAKERDPKKLIIIVLLKNRVMQSKRIGIPNLAATRFQRAVE
jgi:hypothetical protein